MSYTITINFPKMPARAGEYGAEEFWQMILTFTVDDTGSNETHWSYDKNLKLKSLSEASWEYDIEDNDLVVSTLDFVIVDEPVYGVDGYLQSLMEDSTVLKQFTVEIQVDSSTDFNGKVTERGIKYVKKLSEGGGELHARAYPTTDLLAATNVIDERSTPTDNFGYLNAAAGQNVTNVENQQDGTLRITYSGGGINTGDLVLLQSIGGITDANGWHYATREDASHFFIDVATVQDSWSSTGFDNVGVYSSSDVIALTTILEDIFQIVDSGISYAGGDISLKHNWVFREVGATEYDFDELEMFTENFVVGDLLNQQGPPGIQSAKDLLKAFARDFCCFAGVLNNDKAFFHKLFYYDSSDLQTLGLVLEYEFGWEFGLVDYVRAKTIQSDVVHYDAGTYSYDDNRKIDIENVVPFFYTAFSGSGSNVRSISGSNTIIEANDTDVSAAYKDNGQLIADFYYQFRGNIDNIRIDRFKVVGIGYSYTSSFNHFGNKYQIIELRKNYVQGTSEIKAIYLGAV